MRLLHYFVIILIILPFGHAVPPAYYRIVNDIFTNYSTSIRPVRNSEKPTHVKYEVKPIQLIQLNTRYQYVRIMCWVTEYWMDELLYWDPRQYDNMTRIFVPSDMIWKPDSYPYENLIMDENESDSEQPALLETIPAEEKVLIKLSYPVIFHVTCQMKVQEFPHDIQTCRITVGSWTGYATQLVYHPAPITTKYLQDNMEWTMINSTQWEDIVNYSLLEHSTQKRIQIGWSEVYFELVFQRQPGFYIAELIIPTGILIQVCFLGMFTVSQSDGVRTEKITLGITTILALSILLLVVADLLPRGSSPLPKINTFIINEIIIMSIALVFACLLIYMSYYGSNTSRPVPKWLRMIFCLCERKNTVANGKSEENNIELDDSQSVKSRATQRSSNPTSTTPQYVAEIRKIRHQLSLLLQAANEEEEKGEIAAVWMKVVSRLELILLIIFSLISLIETLIFVYVHDQ